jgi:hypothetical protein
VQVGDGMTLADVSVVCSVLPLFQVVLGSEARAAYPALSTSVLDCSENEHFKKALGELGRRGNHQMQLV